MSTLGTGRDDFRRPDRVAARCGSRPPWQPPGSKPAFAFQDIVLGEMLDTVSMRG
jgi:hypothetical protein